VTDYANSNGELLLLCLATRFLAYMAMLCHLSGGSVCHRKARCENYRSALQLAATIGPYLAVWWTALSGDWPFVLLTVPVLGALKVRIFNLQHDCSHRSYFTTRAANDLVGELLGIVTLTPYHYWRWNHLHHHAASGNLDGRGGGDITLYTVREFLKLASTKKLLYRLYRNPFVFLLVGPIYHFMIRMRSPFIAPPHTKRRASIYFVNTFWVTTYMMVFAFYDDPNWFIGVHVASQFIGGMIGLWLFFVQHQFEDVKWKRSDKWNFHEAAHEGSSYLKLPALIEWFVARINLHHIHHVDVQIPNYKLKDVFTEVGNVYPLKEPLSFSDSLRGFRLKLWDEANQRMVGFPDRAAR
jgi:omega-6 fatty acid desaturase (delta-12 desaturase)